MKLFYITRVDIPSNSAQSIQIYAMCKVFAQENIDFKLISPKNYKNENLQSEFRWDKVDIVFKRFKYLEFSVRSFLKVLKEKPTNIFTRDVFIAFILSFFNIKVVYEAHKEPRSKIAHILLNYLKNKNNFQLVVISNALKNFYIKDYNFQKEKILVCHDGVFLESYEKYRNISKDKLRGELNLPKDKFIVMHTGSLYKGKDAELFKVIIDNFPNILFVQVGGKEKEIQKYKDFYKKNNNIIFLPHQSHENIIKYQMSADVLFYALTKSNNLWQYTSPLKLFEYMATEIPILGSNIGSVGEVLNSENAIVFNPEDSNSIIKGMTWILNNRKEAKIRALNALKEVRYKYTWQKRVRKILSFLSKI